MSRRAAPAKINLALVVGPLRPDGRHEVTTVLQQVSLSDDVELERSRALEVHGFAGDTLVRRALESIAEAAGVDPGWTARIAKRIPVAAGLGGGSSDAAAALMLANATLPKPLDEAPLAELAAALGADVPFFLRCGPQLGEGAGDRLSPLDLPQDYLVLLVLPRDEAKATTAAVYESFDRRSGADGYAERRGALLAALDGIGRPRDLAALPSNDLASSPLASELVELGAFRADVSGAGPAVYALFEDRLEAARARERLLDRGRCWIVSPAWYG